MRSKLPAKPSALLRAARINFKTFLKIPNVDFDVSNWLTIATSRQPLCGCFAGATMYTIPAIKKRATECSNLWAAPVHLYTLKLISKPDKNKLTALSAIAFGDVWGFLKILSIPSRVRSNFVGYQTAGIDNKRKFMLDTMKFIHKLEKLGY